jgi:hypothetical protein
LNPLLKLLEKIAMAFDFNEDALSRVRHAAVEFQFCRETVNKWAKPNSLNGTANDHFQSFRRARRSRPSNFWWRAESGVHVI